MRLHTLLVLCLTPVLAVAAAAGDTADLPAADEILAQIDSNLVFETRTATIKMTVEGKRRTRVYSMRSYGRGETDSAIEYTEPARDQGTRMLRLGEQLWLYMPLVDRTQKISGHMLRQGMMGSDLSYEDMLSSEELRQQYEARVLGEAELDDRACWKLEMTATDESVAYPRRVSWIDQETFIPLRQELYALSGMLLKTWTMGEVRDFEGGRKFPTRMVVEDHLKKESRTLLELSEMEFGVELEEEVFSMRWLERK